MAVKVIVPVSSHKGDPMSQIVVATVTVNPPVTIVGKDPAETTFKLVEWARSEWFKIFDLPCPSDDDVVLSRVLHANSAHYHFSHHTVQ